MRSRSKRPMYQLLIRCKTPGAAVFVPTTTLGRSHRSATREIRCVTSSVTTTPATTRVTANGAGRSANARTMVVTFSIGAPTTNESTKFVEAPRPANDGAITDEQHEQNGCGRANSAPRSDPVKPVRTKYGLK